MTTPPQISIDFHGSSLRFRINEHGSFAVVKAIATNEDGLNVGVITFYVHTEDRKAVAHSLLQAAALLSLPAKAKETV